MLPRCGVRDTISRTKDMKRRKRYNLAGNWNNSVLLQLRLHTLDNYKHRLVSSGFTLLGGVVLERVEISGIHIPSKCHRLVSRYGSDIFWHATLTVVVFLSAGRWSDVTAVLVLRPSLIRKRRDAPVTPVSVYINTPNLRLSLDWSVTEAAGWVICSLLICGLRSRPGREHLSFFISSGSPQIAWPI